VLPLQRDDEHALVVLTGAIVVDGTVVEPGHLAYLGLGRDELGVAAEEPTRVLLIGGEPFDEQVLMWWNFVARTREEIRAAQSEWTAASERFGRVASMLPRIEVGPPPWAGQ
jgi:quercetin 2,3-dioxygenase